MIEAVLVAPFLLDGDVDLCALLEAGATEATRRVVAALPDPWRARPPSTPAAGVLLDEHTSYGAVRLPHALAEATREAPEVPGLPPRTRLGDLTLHVSPLGTASLVVPVRLARAGDLDAAEAALVDAFAPHVALLARVIGGALGTEPATGHRLPGGTILWLHRLLISGGAAARKHTEYAVPVALRGGGTAYLGSGYSRLEDATGGERDAVVRALLYSTDRWLALDLENRRLADGLIRLRVEGERDLRAAYAESLRLSEAASLTSLVLSEQSRYVANAEMLACHALAEAWGVTADQEDVAQRVSVLRELAERYLAQERGRLERRRTSLAYVFTGISTLAVVLVVVDALTDDVTVRRATAIGVAVAALAWFAAVLVRDRRAEQRRPGAR